MSYAIEVTTAVIRLRTLAAEDLTVTFFVHPVAHADYRPESVGDRLNDPRCRFLPCEIDGESHLVRLESIAYIEMSEPPPEVATSTSVGALQAPVELLLRSGERLTGVLLYQAERGEERVSDMLNRSPDRFLLLLDGSRSYFVQRDAIDRIRL